jgi:hypothetical protein
MKKKGGGKKEGKRKEGEKYEKERRGEKKERKKKKEDERGHYFQNIYFDMHTYGITSSCTTHTHRTYVTLLYPFLSFLFYSFFSFVLFFIGVNQFLHTLLSTQPSNTNEAHGMLLQTLMLLKGHKRSMNNEQLLHVVGIQLCQNRERKN